MEFLQVPRMTLGPSKCFFCGRHEGEAIDTTIQRPPPVGHVYVCVACCDDLIRVRGGLTRAAAEQVVKQRNAAERTLVEREAEVIRLRPYERVVRKAAAELEFEPEPTAA